jgi:hypothetical protein
MFQRLGLRFVLLTRHGVLQGVLTKMVRSPCSLLTSFLRLTSSPHSRRTCTLTSTAPPPKPFTSLEGSSHRRAPASDQVDEAKGEERGKRWS